MTETWSQTPETHPVDDDPRHTLLLQIHSLQRQASRGLWLLVLFLLSSLLAYGSFGMLPTLSPETWDLLGPPPPPHLISAALFVYIFSAIILTLGRMMEGGNTRGGWQHLGYLLVFYSFYHVAGELEAHFWAVFATGVTVLSLEGYRIWNCCTEQIRENREELERLERMVDFT
ncbi:MAG: menaquinol oxidoreductase [Desulfuromonas sp.]|nr:MAG: menaquinol oxidoreductase [Desulfuromonas sp.]